MFLTLLCWCCPGGTETDRVVMQGFKDENNNLRCRFYENQYPEPEEVVMVNVTEIGDMGAYVTLLEYDNIEVTRPAALLVPADPPTGHDLALRAVTKTHPLYPEVGEGESHGDRHGDESRQREG